jgi:predicted glycosyltransferase
MRIWIDLANSPHPLLFAPIARRLAGEGHEVAITVRDHAQTVELTHQRFPEATVVGGPSPGGRLAKLSGLGARIRDLRSWARRTGPDVAISHNSYAQLAAARSLGIPAVTAMDFEHQPANHIGFRCAQRILVPEAVPLPTIRRQGARVSKLIRYKGLKEQLYLADFEPDRDILEKVGIDRGPEIAVAVARTAPAGAAYHRGDNSVLSRALTKLSEQPRVRTVVLARLPRQAAAISALGLDRVQVADRAVDSRSLMLAADLFLGAGGTMTREAALLGTPTFTLFEGRPAAVDSWLETQGKLRRLTDPAQVSNLRPRGVREVDLEGVRQDGGKLVDLFCETILAAASLRSPRGS